MAEPVNLNKARKARARDQARAKADANAAKSGVPKAEKHLAAARLAKAARDLDALKRE
jgi:hypothetical protein